MVVTVSVAVAVALALVVVVTVLVVGVVLVRHGVSLSSGCRQRATAHRRGQAVLPKRQTRQAVLALAAGLLAGTAPAPAAGPAPVAAAADTYSWKNARTDGGGLVPGIVLGRLGGTRA
ncbi:hypothetical protein GCM10020295_13850 [Streptomyces cinereospinus]